MGVTIKSNVNVQQKISEVSNRKLWAFVGREWHGLIVPFTPFRTGIMAAYVEIDAEDTKVIIRYNEPYAKKNYYGNFNWRKDLHPLATGRWDKAAEPTQKIKLIQAIKAYLARGGILG